MHAALAIEIRARGAVNDQDHVDRRVGSTAEFPSIWRALLCVAEDRRAFRCRYAVMEFGRKRTSHSLRQSERL
jgi:hypothetical protein